MQKRPSEKNDGFGLVRYFLHEETLHRSKCDLLELAKGSPEKSGLSPQAMFRRSGFAFKGPDGNGKIHGTAFLTNWPLLTGKLPHCCKNGLTVPVWRVLAAVMVLKIYGDRLSQPTRALMIFARANEIAYEFVDISIRNMDHKKPEYMAINPLGKVPAIDDGGFKLCESHAILKYLAASRSVADHWYPKDVKKRALVDYVLDWHHTNLRQGSMNYLRQTVLNKISGLPSNEEVAQQNHVLLLNSLTFIEDVWLTGPGPFLWGATEISVADLALVCEIKQTLLMGTAGTEEMLGPRERLTKWIKAVEDTLAPHFADVTATLAKVSDILEAKRNTEKKSSL